MSIEKSFKFFVYTIAIIIIVFALLGCGGNNNTKPTPAFTAPPNEQLGCTLVKSFDEGVFTLENIDNKRMLSGMFSYSKGNNPMVVALQNGKWVNGSLLGRNFINPESVCALESYKGVVAATERAGEIFHSPDGVTGWKRVAQFNGEPTSCGLETHKDEVFVVASNQTARTGHVYKSADGRNYSRVGGNIYYGRNLQSYGGDLHLHAVDNNDHPIWFTMSNGGWIKQGPPFSNHRVFRSIVSDGKMWFSRAKYYSPQTTTGLSVFVKGRGVKHVINDNRFTHFTELGAGTRPNGNKLIIAGASKDWKSSKPGGALFVARADSETSGGRICSFDEAWVSGVSNHNGKCFVSTWSGNGYTGYGRIYRVNGLTCNGDW